MLNSRAKYSYLNEYSTDMLEIISKADCVQGEPTKTALRGAATYILNQRAGKHKQLPTPAQRRAMMLGQMSFFATSAICQLRAVRNAFNSAPHSDLGRNETVWLDMQLIDTAYEVERMLFALQQVIRNTSKKLKQEGAQS
jgi:hypothetical protein